MLEQEHIGTSSHRRHYPALSMPPVHSSKKTQDFADKTGSVVAHSFDEPISLRRRLAAEAIGTAFLLIAIAGSGILGERLAAGNTAIVLLANALATGATLFALIAWFTPLSGAHFNPVVTLVMTLRGDISRGDAAAYMPVQVLGAVVGVGVANLMFDLPLFSLSLQIRSGPSYLLSEFVSTFGLVGAVWTCSKLRPLAVPAVVAAYIGGAFWFTASSFANPAVTIARALTDTFSGIRSFDVPDFIAAQIAGALAAAAIFKWLLPSSDRAIAPESVPGSPSHKPNP